MKELNEHRPLTVGELKKLLNEHEDNMFIALASDAEGNRFAPLTRFGFAGAMKMDGTLREVLEDDDESGYWTVVLYPED